MPANSRWDLIRGFKGLIIIIIRLSFQSRYLTVQNTMAVNRERCDLHKSLVTSGARGGAFG